jgi:EAL domain-containing protein (putative c-di-GMP-specific phosphodiesterase class I)
MLGADLPGREILLPLPTAKVAPSEATDEPAAADSLGRQLRAALPPIRVHSLSIHNESGDAIWLSEGALGPDEHNLVIDALATLNAADNRDIHRTTLDDGRSAIFLAARAPRGDLVGLVMVLADPKSLKGEAPFRVVTPPLRAVLQKIAVLLRPKSGVSGSTNSWTQIATAGANAATSGSELALLSGSVPILPPARLELPVLAPIQLDDVLTWDQHGLLEEPTIPSTSAAPESVTDQEQTAAADLVLNVQQLTRLRSGGRTRRYEVLARSRRDAGRKQVPPAFVAPAARGREGAVLDGLVLRRLLVWLGENPVVWDAEPASFSINLSIGALEDPKFLQALPAELARSGVAAECIGFEINELACNQSTAQVERFVAECEKIGCFLVLDNFSLDARAVPFLRSPTVRLVKIDARLTSSALKDKLSQALVVAIVQACKVLGIHCVAKSVESQAALQWLTAVGCDLAQGFVLDRPLPLESLAASAGCTKASSGFVPKPR